MHKKKKLTKKALLCLLGIIILAFIASTYVIQKAVTPKEGLDMMSIEVREELAALDQIQSSQFLESYEGKTFLDKEYLTFGDVKKIMQEYPVDNEKEYFPYYLESSFVKKKDWNRYFEKVMEQYANGEMKKESFSVIAKGSDVRSETGELFDEETLLVWMDEPKEDQISLFAKILQNRSVSGMESVGSVISAIVYEDCILSVFDISEDEIDLNNVYLLKEEEGNIIFFWNHYEISAGMAREIVSDGSTDLLGQKIADLSFTRQGIEKIRLKKERINGKVLKITGEEMEIEGYGMIPVSENMTVYQLYGAILSKDQEDIRIGYSFTDFVIEDGTIQSALLMKEENMEFIRVLIKNSDYEGRYHDSLTITCDSSYRVIYYENGLEKSVQEMGSGENTVIQTQDIRDEKIRVKILPDVLSAKMTLQNVARSQGAPSYTGSFEIVKETEGLILLNEVQLEEYLYHVVPSEMPSSYPLEALKAQAICARTYAYGKILHAGLAQYGAHVDDSAGFQVYNNIKEQLETTRSVRETFGKILMYENEPVGAYYYSTSCGVGTDTSIWKGSGENPPYIVPGLISKNSDPQQSAQRFCEEEEFSEYIRTQDPYDYEYAEGWYRWTYTVDEIHTERIEEILNSRYESNSKQILTRQKDGEYISTPIKKIGKIEDIRIEKRNIGGVADELVIYGTKAVVKVIGELNIRYVLNDGEAKIIRKTKDEVNSPKTLPSAFFVIDTFNKDGYVVGYKLTGGGFGHGVGLSQNAAKAMADEGMTCEEILTVFYHNSIVTDVIKGDYS